MKRVCLKVVALMAMVMFGKLPAMDEFDLPDLEPAAQRVVSCIDIASIDVEEFDAYQSSVATQIVKQESYSPEFADTVWSYVHADGVADDQEFDPTLPFSGVDAFAQELEADDLTCYELDALESCAPHENLEMASCAAPRIFTRDAPSLFTYVRLNPRSKAYKRPYTCEECKAVHVAWGYWPGQKPCRRCLSRG